MTTETKTIRARVEQRMLKKAAQLFSGSPQSRQVELTQNARRAGAKNLWITLKHKDNRPDDAEEAACDKNFSTSVTFADDGCGISDLQSLMALGRSDWDSDIQFSEDAGGSGFFSLYGLPVTIESLGQVMRLEDEAQWCGEADITISPGHPPKAGADHPWTTRISFVDEYWGVEQLVFNTMFTGLNVFINGQQVQSAPFIDPSWASKKVDCLGCTLALVKRDEYMKRMHQLRAAHRPLILHAAAPDLEEDRHRLGRYYAHGFENRPGNGVVNFHGLVFDECLGIKGGDQCAGFEHASKYMYVGEEYVALVDIGHDANAAGLKLTLPSRSDIFANYARKRLVDEVFNYRLEHITRLRLDHHLGYKVWHYAVNTLGLDMHQAKPRYGRPSTPTDGYGDSLWWSDVYKNRDLIRVRPNHDLEEKSENSLTDYETASAALWVAENEEVVDGRNARSGGHDHTFVHVNSRYNGYPWADELPLVSGVSVIASDRLLADEKLYVNGCHVEVYKRLAVVVSVSDGRELTIPVAVVQRGSIDYSGTLCVSARHIRSISSRTAASLTGGFSEDYDYSQQENEVEEELTAIALMVKGPNEKLRHYMIDKVNEVLCDHNMNDWESAIISRSGMVRILRPGQKEFVCHAGLGDPEDDA